MNFHLKKYGTLRPLPHANIPWKDKISKKKKIMLFTILVFQKNIYFCFIDCAKAFDYVDHNKLWKILQEMGIPDWPASWETCMQVRKQQLELDMEQQTGSKSGKEYVKAVYCHSASVQFRSVAQLCPTLCDPMNRSTPGLPVHHQFPESTQTHVHWVGDTIQPSHPLSSPSPPAPNLSQPQGLFKWVSSSHQVAKVLEFQLQHQSFQWMFSTDFL